MDRKIVRKSGEKLQNFVRFSKSSEFLSPNPQIKARNVGTTGRSEIGIFEKRGSAEYKTRDKTAKYKEKIADPTFPTNTGFTTPLTGESSAEVSKESFASRSSKAPQQAEALVNSQVTDSE